MLVLALALELTVAASSPREADQAFRAGRNLLQEGRVAEACAAFEESYRLDAALGTLLNLAECEATRGRNARAYALFQEVLAWSRRVKNPAREGVALGRLQELKPKVALLVVDAAPGERVRVDGVEVVAGAQVPVEPGPHEVELSGPERTLTRTVAAKAGEGLAVRLEPAPAPPVEDAPVAVPPPQAAPKPVEPAVAAAPQGPVVTQEPARRSSRFGAALLIASAAALVAGVAVLAWSVWTWDRMQRQQPGGPDFDSPTVTEAELQRASVAYPISLVLSAAGALGVAGGALLTWRGSF